MTHSENLLLQDRLWGNHYWQTREVISSAYANGPCLNIHINTLYEYVEMQGDNFGVLVKNRAAGIKLGLALRKHITVAIQIVQAGMGKKSITGLYEEWQINASDIANIYSTYNRKISYSKINMYMQSHLRTTLAEAMEIINGDCKEAYKKGEIALAHIEEMSQYIMSRF